MELLSNFSQIEIESPADKIIGQIKELISSGQLNAGDRLPSERMLSDRLGVGRTHLREALRKLEFYGILKTHPQSGTVVAGMGLPALEGLITDMLSLHGNDFKSLVETRVILESNAAMLAAIHRTDEDLIELESALEAHKKKVRNDESSVEEDLLFHLKIAEASKNSVLKSLMLIITPDIMSYFKTHDVCGEGRSEIALKQHDMLLKYIREGKSEAAGTLLKEHLNDIVIYVNSLNFNVEENRMHKKH
ncbi:MAG: FadR/GntR family transcriptional regulator [Cyclobacteriaceae bacterium]